ncbi:MAG: imidazole glycerol phosphate synthase subunit HisH [Ruminococcaceae bacterium]|nr:imidazole glycerol phosphate synthase subunit HisH [Oscillospiraceae bacterium]
MSLTAIIDYGVGNLFSLTQSLKAIGSDAVVTNKEDEIRKADRIILPGVGAFEDAVKKLYSTGLVQVIMNEVSNGKPLLGICLGMQLLFDKSFEYGEHKGLGLIPGEVVPLEGAINPALKVPHIGWNKLNKTDIDEPLFNNLTQDSYVYYVHSFYAKTDKQYITGVSEYGIEVTGSVRYKNVIGMQFHPEKSGRTGLSILKSFCDL